MWWLRALTGPRVGRGDHGGTNAAVHAEVVVQLDPKRRQREIASIHFLHPLNEPPTDLMRPFIAEPAHAETAPL